MSYRAYLDVAAFRGERQDVQQHVERSTTAKPMRADKTAEETMNRAALDPASLKQHRAEIDERGYTILRDVVAPARCDEIMGALNRLERDLGIETAKNRFEGRATKRIYNLLAHGPLFEAIAVEPTVLSLVEWVLDAGCQVSSLSSIAILPGEREQPIHADDQLIPVAKPHEAFVCNTMWAITDFTKANGATRLIAGTHRESKNPEFGQTYDTVPAEMSKGSVLVYHGSLWHGGGPNQTETQRVGIAMNYCAGFIRQQENQLLGLPRHTIERFSPRLRELVGYSVYNGIIGHVDRSHPTRWLL